MNESEFNIISSPVPAPCGACGGQCCSAKFGWNAIALHDDESQLFPSQYLKRTFDDLIHPYRYMFSSKVNNGECVHLKEGKCAIYTKRPEACQQFDCVEYYVNDAPRLFQNMEEDVHLFMKNLLVSHVSKRQ